MDSKREEMKGGRTRNLSYLEDSQSASAGALLPKVS
jgi:hypothetical protein